MEGTTDSSVFWFTWDADNMYIGWSGRELSTGLDVSLYFDTVIAGAEDTYTTSYGLPVEMDYLLSIDGTSKSVDVLFWDGSGWQGASR